MPPLAVGAKTAHKALGDDAGQRVGDEVAFHAHVQQARDAAGGVVGMQRTHHKVTVMDACTAMDAVSRSRISPIMIMSGS